MPQYHPTKTDAELAAEALALYEAWRRRAGMPPESRWREKLAKAGIPLEPPQPTEVGDAFEGPLDI